MPFPASSAPSSASLDSKGWVIFLDVDGVLLPVTRYSFGGGELDPACVKRLENLVQFLQNGGGQQREEFISIKENHSPPNTSLSSSEQGQVETCDLEKNKDKEEEDENKHPRSFYPVTLILSSTWRNFPDMVDRLNRFFSQHCNVAPTEPSLCTTRHVQSDADKVVSRASISTEMEKGTFFPADYHHHDLTKYRFPLVTGGLPNGTVLVSSVSYYEDNPSEQRLVRDRVDEIYAWLHEHVEDHPEAIGGRWLAIDDMKLDVDERMQGHFLHTKTEIGLTEEDVEAAKKWIQEGLPTVEEARKAAMAARADPVLFQEKIEIERVLKERLQLKLEEVTRVKEEKESKLKEMTEAFRDVDKQLRDLKKQHEDVVYRLALLEYSKKIPFLEELVQISKKMSGKERREIDSKIAKYVQLLQRQKTLENTLRKQRRKQGGKNAEKDEASLPSQDGPNTNMDNIVLKCED